MVTLDCRTDDGWLERGLAAYRYDGCFIVEGVLEEALVALLKATMYATQSAIREEVGEQKLEAAGELGVLRLMLKHDPIYFRLLELPELLAVVDATLSETAILHVQNGLVLPSFAEGATPEVFQTRFHRDFPRILNGYPMSMNTFFALDEFSAATGGTLFAPGTHQIEGRPPDFYLEHRAPNAECGPGAMIVFDSTLWHAAGDNTSGHDRLAINQQFTRSYVKQQIDYVRALGDDVVLAQVPRTQQLLGWYTRVVTSLDEFYRPAEERLYRSGQE